MGITGEVILSVDEQQAFAELAEGYQDPRDTIALGGLTAVMERVQNEAIAQTEQVVTDGESPVAQATAFQSSY